MAWEARHRGTCAQEALSPEEARLCLLAALLLPLAGCSCPGAKKRQVALTGHVVLESIKWRRKDAEAVASLHAAAPGLLRVHRGLQVVLPQQPEPPCMLCSCGSAGEPACCCSTASQ